MSYVNYNNFFAQIEKKFIDQFGSSNIEIYLEFLFLILGEQFDKSSLHVRSKLLDLLFILNFSNPAKTNMHLKKQLNSDEKTKMFLKSLLKFFVNIEFMTDYVDISQSKYRYR